METVYEAAEFLARGAAWGMFWLAGLGLLKKNYANAELLGILIFIFIMSAGLTAFAFFRDLYAEYSTADAATKERILSQYKGKDGLALIVNLVVTASPLLFLLKQIKSMKIIVVIVSACYISTTYHQQIIDFVVK